MTSVPASQIALVLFLGVLVGIVLTYILVYFFIVKKVKAVSNDAVEKILLQNQEFYDGLNYKNHMDLKAEVQNQLLSKGLMNADEIVPSLPHHEPITKSSIKPLSEKKSKVIKDKLTKKKKPVSKPKTTKKGLPIIKLMKGGK